MAQGSLRASPMPNQPGRWTYPSYTIVSDLAICLNVFRMCWKELQPESEILDWFSNTILYTKFEGDYVQSSTPLRVSTTWKEWASAVAAGNEFFHMDSKMSTETYFQVGILSFFLL
jgi:hypothetical protein